MKLINPRQLPHQAHHMQAIASQPRVPTRPPGLRSFQGPPMPVDMALEGDPSPPLTSHPMAPLQGPPVPMQMQLNGKPAPAPMPRPNNVSVTTGSKVHAASISEPRQLADMGADYFPAASEPHRTVLDAFGKPVSEGVQRRARELKDFHAGQPLHRAGQFGNQALAEALMKRKQIGLR